MSDVIAGEDGVRRCAWGAADPLYRAYHDDEWGRPLHGDDALFELLTLEGFQAGLAWITILRKREGFRSAFGGFEIERVARYDESDVERLLGDAGIVRHRGKIEAAIGNARAMSASRRPRRPGLVVCARSAAEASCGARRGAGLDRRVARAVEGAEAPRLSVRRADDRLRVHAVGRPGRRSSGGCDVAAGERKPSAGRRPR